MLNKGYLFPSIICTDFEIGQIFGCWLIFLLSFELGINTFLLSQLVLQVLDLLVKTLNLNFLLIKALPNGFIVLLVLNGQVLVLSLHFDVSPNLIFVLLEDPLKSLGIIILDYLWLVQGISLMCLYCGH